MLLEQIGTSSFELALSNALVYEYEDVLSRHLNLLAFTLEDIHNILGVWARNSHWQEPYFRWRPQLSDPKDEHVLELAINARARYIVTFNIKDFVAAPRFGIEVILPLEFWRRHVAPTGG